MIPKTGTERKVADKILFLSWQLRSVNCDIKSRVGDDPKSRDGLQTQCLQKFLEILCRTVFFFFYSEKLNGTECLRKQKQMIDLSFILPFLSLSRSRRILLMEPVSGLHGGWLGKTAGRGWYQSLRRPVDRERTT